MMVPRTRLLLFAALVAVPGSLAYALHPAWLLPVGVLWLAALVLALLDGLFAGRGLRALAGRLPEVVRLTKEREGVIPVFVSSASQRPLRLEMGLALPAGFTAPSEVHRIVLASESAEKRFDLPCTPLQRGRFSVENIYLRAPSSLGFWNCRRVLPAQAELRVYPNLQKERSRLAALFLNKGGLGAHVQRRVGKGRDFEQLREYIPGDSFEDIHWKATARRGHPVTKMYQIERTQEVYVVIDTSRLSARAESEDGQAPVTQLEQFITAAMTLGLVAQKQGDLFGLVAFSDRVERLIRAAGGMSHFNAVREAVYTLEARPVNPDYEELFTTLRLRLRRRALLIILTGLDDPLLAESFSRNLPLIARTHLVLVNMILPPQIRPVFSAANAETPEDVYDRLGAHLQWRDLRELQQTLHRQGIAMHLLSSASLAPDLVSQYVSVKQRQLI